MVTHNYEQATAYVTRKIRIHDGEVVVDVPVNEGAEPQGKLAEDSPAHKSITPDGAIEAAGAETTGRSLKPLKTAWFFAKKNAFTQLGRASLFIIFLTIIAVASFLLLGELFLYEDDIVTKLYSNKAFYQECDTRLVVKKADGTSLTEEDYEKLRDVSNVLVVDSCDYANDINYYIEEDVDFEYLYSFNWHDREEKKTIKFLSDTKFMRSADCITEEDLAYGRLPEAGNEVVLYAEDDSLLGRTRQCYFKANNIWDDGEYYDADLKIVGILKEETEQIYFTTEFCEMLSMHIDSGVYRICYDYNYEKMDYNQMPELVPVIADDLTGNQVRVSSSIESAVSGEVLFRFQGYDENGELIEEYIEETVEVQKNTTSHSKDFLEVSREFYEKYYSAGHEQASVYITSYAKTDEVMGALKRMGYDALSTIRVSSADYDEKLVYDRLKVMAICFGGLLALIMAEVLILRSLMKIRMKDYFVLKFIGMEMKMIRKISYLEIGVYCLVALILTIALMWGLRLAGIPIIAEMMWYYEARGYLIFVVYNLSLSAVTVAAFNRLLKGRLNA